jgi:hypothetical protein
VATEVDAHKQRWLSMKDARNQFTTEEEFIKRIAGITLFTDEEVDGICKEEVAAWPLFSKKVSNTATLLFSSHIFPKYIKHVLRKFIANGYSRI